MPTYFDKNNLTAAQAARWDYAMQEYVRVRAANHGVALPPEGATAKSSEILSGSWLCPEPGHPKSALFARLLNGKAALPVPPPTAYSYPWYAVVEDSGPFEVQLSRFTWSDVTDTRINMLAINQCEWQIASLNEAAARLMLLADQGTRQTQIDAGVHTASLSAVVDTYQAKPEFIVRYGHGPTYRLFIGRKTSRAVRHYAQAVVAGVYRVGRLESCGDVFDTDNVQLNACIGATMSLAEHPQAQVAALQASLAAMPFVRPLLDKAMAELPQVLAAYDANPTANDWVQLHYDGWFLEKC